jgi:hypothetical protein
MRLCGSVCGRLDCGRRRGVDSNRVMLGVMMRYMVVQETPEITKWTGGMFLCFDGRRRMLLGCRTHWRRGGNGGVWYNGGVGL